MNTLQLTRAKQVLLRDLDRILQSAYHQRLGEVINDLRLHDIELSPNPSPDDIFLLMRRSRVLWCSSLPEIESVRRSIDRVASGSLGVCDRCKKEIGAEVLEANPFARFCPKCISQAGN